MLKICKEASDIFKQHCVLHYDAFKLSNTNESIYQYVQHMKEVMVKMEKDERAGEMMKQSMDLLPPGAKFIVGDFERLKV
jgi:hypothetical protein